jgi:hypothetical protein
MVSYFITRRFRSREDYIASNNIAQYSGVSSLDFFKALNAGTEGNNDISWKLSHIGRFVFPS